MEKQQVQLKLHDILNEAQALAGSRDLDDPGTAIRCSQRIFTIASAALALMGVEGHPQRPVPDAQLLTDLADAVERLDVPEGDTETYPDSPVQKDRAEEYQAWENLLDDLEEWPYMTGLEDSLSLFTRSHRYIVLFMEEGSKKEALIAAIQEAVESILAAAPELEPPASWKERCKS